jgi:hypothetical protein
MAYWRLCKVTARSESSGELAKGCGVYHKQAKPGSHLLMRDEAACERRNRAARECLGTEIRRANHVEEDAGSKQNIAMYLGLLKSMNSSALATAADKAERGSNQALQAACRLELAARRGPHPKASA